MGVWVEVRAGCCSMGAIEEGTCGSAGHPRDNSRRHGCRRGMRGLRETVLTATLLACAPPSGSERSGTSSCAGYGAGAMRYRGAGAGAGCFEGGGASVGGGGWLRGEEREGW